MATTPTRTLVRPHLDQLSGLAEVAGAPTASELERRAQELINEWLKFYFSGDPFSTPAPQGPDTLVVHEACEILFGSGSPTDPSTRPILHTILADRRDDDGVRVGGGLVAHTGEWTWNTLVRVHPQMPANPAAISDAETSARLAADQVARRVGDQLAWLLRSRHTQDLAFKGVGQVRVLNGPRRLQSGAWHLSQIVWSAKVHFHLAAP